MITTSKSRNPTLHMLRGWHCRFVKLAGGLQSPFLLLVRLYWGWQFLTTGWGKLHNLSRVAEFFASLNIPAPAFTAQCVATLEFLGGILLIAGLATRIIGFLLSANMIVAYLTDDRAALKSIFSDPAKFYNADPFTFLMAALIALIFGAGYLSLDYALSHRPAKRTAPVSSLS